MTQAAFRKHIWSWYRQNGRHHLPWRRTRDPYAIFVSEVMLQQTQVSRVLKAYPKFLRSFPTVAALAAAPLANVLRAWQGMGYNRRAAYLKRAAAAIVKDHAGRVPDDPEALRRLPGIGPATAGAISAFAFNRRVVFIETNIRRVYLHWFFSGRPNVRDVEISRKVARTMPRRDPRRWYWALMDYGSSGLKGLSNPNRMSAHYTAQPPFAGSRRELRGRIIRSLTASTLTRRQLTRRLSCQPRRVGQALRDLSAEGLLVVRNGRIAISP